MSTAIRFRNSEVQVASSGMEFLLAGYSGAPFSTGLQPAAADRMGEIGVGKSRLTVVAQSGNDPP